MTCAFIDCGLPVKARGICHGHYKQYCDGRPFRPLIHRRGPDGCLTCLDIEWLSSWGTPQDVIAARMGFADVGSMRDHLYKHDRRDLLRVLSVRAAA